MVIGKYTDVFTGIFLWCGGSGEGCYVGGSFHEGMFHGGKEFSIKGGDGFYTKVFLVLSKELFILIKRPFVSQGSFLKNWNKIRTLA